MTNIITGIAFLLSFICIILLNHSFHRYKEDQNMVEFHLNMQIADLKEEIQKIKGSENGN